MKIDRGIQTDPVRLNGAGASSTEAMRELASLTDGVGTEVVNGDTVAAQSSERHLGPSVRTLFWFVVAASVMATTEMFKTFVFQEAQHRPIPLTTLVEQNFPWWLSWAVLVPAIFWLGEKYRLDERDHLSSRIPVHFVAAALLAAIHVSVSALLYYYSDFSYMPAQAREFLPKSPQAIVVRWLGAYLIMDMVTYGVILGMYYVLDYQRRLRREALVSERLRVQSAQLQHRMVEATLHALRMELNPHFLFNALNSISALVRKKGKQRCNFDDRITR